MTTFVCYNRADNFFHLCIETHESHTCLTLAKNPPIVEKLFLMVALKSTTLHLLPATSWKYITSRKVDFRERTRDP